jgi:hypothetical protein
VPVRYLRCIYVPAEDRCICLFEAADLEAVRRVNDIAQVPFHRISPAVEFRAPGGGHAGTEERGALRKED